MPAPPAVTAPPIVSVPVAVRLMPPLAAVATAPVVVSGPMLLTLMPPPFSLMPVIVSGLAVSLRLIAPLVVFVALKLPTVLAPFRAWPLMELVVSRPLVPNAPLPDSVIAPPAVASIAPDALLTAALTSRSPPVESSVTVPAPPAVTTPPIVSVAVAVRLMPPLAAVVTAPVVVSGPVLLTLMPPPLSLMPVIVSGLAVSLRLIAPLVALVALKLPTVLAPFSVWPLVELVVSRPLVPKAPLPDSVIAPPAVASIAPTYC